ncbi:methyl-accepting chemotaxis protein [Actinoplanes sp. NPDC026619]|uniref:methyl-accepting chemotaxis protein n=1 Tax=Actinoplanes sp. NPDC026619 TaxID=3155798 RepID=UPI0033D63EDF
MLTPVTAERTQPLATLGLVEAAGLRTRLDMLDHILDQTSTGFQKFSAAIDTEVADIDTMMATIDPATLDAAARKQLDTYNEQWPKFVDVVKNQVLPLSAAGKWRAAYKLNFDVARPFSIASGDALHALYTAETDAAAKHAAESRAAARSARVWMIVALAAGVVLAALLGMLIGNLIRRDLEVVRATLRRLAGGDLTARAGIASRDEVGQMAVALDEAMGTLQATVSTMAGASTSLDAASNRMAGATTQIAASADETAAQAHAVSAAADEVSRSVETVSAGSEEMGASIREISQNASEAARVAAEAVTVTSATSATMNKLGDSSAEIGNVIKTITSIAEQTNLLALNATIEAARAGEMGKGFAVVASEVKDLAQETARATEDISRRVQAIQSDTSGAVTAIEEISVVIERISEFQTTIASAVEEQTATTAEMNRSVSEASSGTVAIAQNITGVAAAAQRTSHGVSETQEATAELSRMSTELSRLVSTFRI